MKKIYIKPSTDFVAIASERKILESSGVANNPLAKKAEVEIEEENNGLPTAFKSVWDDDEEE
ncbi:MAG: hypothetical protein IKX61_03020 [Prevotella sp.]|nr:hypothetical protein [Prevotella sp.]